jgi:hypothetical protein
VGEPSEGTLDRSAGDVPGRRQEDAEEAAHGLDGA